MRYMIKEKLIPALFGGLAIFIVSYMLELTIGSAILFASLGASTVILSEFPDTRMAKLRVVVIAYFIAAVIGYFCSFITYLPFAAGLAIFLTIALMLVFNHTHAPAGGIALAFVFYSRESIDLAYVVLTVLALLIILKSVIYIYKKELHIKKFHHEFIK